MNSKLLQLLSFALLFLPPAVLAGEASEVLSAPKSLSLTHHIVGYLSIVVTVLAYVAAMSEEVIELRKSKPMVLGSAVVWFAICIYYALHGEAKVAVFYCNNEETTLPKSFIRVAMGRTSCRSILLKCLLMPG